RYESDPSQLSYSVVDEPVADAWPASEGGELGLYAGDHIVQNANIRIAVQAPSFVPSTGHYGGNIVAADVVRGDDAWRDGLGELIPLIGRTFTPAITSVERYPVDEARAVVMRTQGSLADFKFINLPFAVTEITRLILGGESIGFS